jgi:lipopolysaccharide export system protein LptA
MLTALLATALAASPASPAAPTAPASRLQFQLTIESPRTGTIRLENMGQLSTDIEPKHTRFVGLGNPMRGVWVQQRMTVETRRVEGRAVRIPNGLQLEQATMSGGIDARMLRASRNPASRQDQVLTLRGAEGRFTILDNTFELTGGVNLNQNDPGANTTTAITAKRGTVALTQAPSTAAGAAIRTAQLRGNVTVNIRSERLEEQQGQRRAVPYTLNAVAQVMTYSTEANTITLEQNVRIDGTDPTLIGSVENVNRAVIRLDANGQPAGVDFFGSPGTTRMRQTGGTTASLPTLFALAVMSLSAGALGGSGAGSARGRRD